MAKAKKMAGPRIEDGIKLEVVAANKKSLTKLRDEAGDKAYLFDNMLSLSPEQFVGKKAGEDYLMESAAKWSGKALPYVMIRDIDAVKHPKVKELKGKIKKEEALLSSIKEKSDVRSFKAKLVTCATCESKLNKNYVVDAVCPLCGASLRSKSALASIHLKEDKIRRLKISLSNELKRRAGDAPLKYLVAVPLKGEKK